MKPPRLDEAIDDILDAIKELLEAAVAPGELLEGTADIIRGDRARPRPPTPALWLFAGTAVPSHSTFGLQETWEMPVTLSAVIKNDEPEEGYKEATGLAAKAKSVVIKDRSLGLGHRKFIQDVKSGSFEPSSPQHRQGSLFGSAAQLVVIFRTFDY